jgi:hypothetical protein
VTRRDRVSPQSALRVLAIPVLLACLSLVGLVIGLTGDGWRDAVSSALLLLPLTALAWHWFRKSR